MKLIAAVIALLFPVYAVLVLPWVLLIWIMRKYTHAPVGDVRKIIVFSSVEAVGFAPVLSGPCASVAPAYYLLLLKEIKPIEASGYFLATWLMLVMGRLILRYWRNRHK